MTPLIAATSNVERGSSNESARDASSHLNTANHAMLAPLARRLGVSEASLARLGCTSRGNGSFAFPERDSQGEVTGWSRRFSDGRKGFDAGGRRGLTLAWPLDNYAGATERDPVLIVEGASDVAAGLDAGLSVVGRPSAAGGLSELAALLKNRHVAVVAERDDAGRRGAAKIASGLAGAASSVRIATPPAPHKDLRAWLTSDDPPSRGDVSLWLADAPAFEAGGDEAAGALAAGGPGGGPAVSVSWVDVSQVEPRPVRWLWRGRIALGKVTLLAGDPGLGKSFLTLDLAARVSQGMPMPGEALEPREPASVVLLSAEDDVADTIRPRLDAAGADVTRIRAIESMAGLTDRGERALRSVDLSRDVARLRDEIPRELPDCRLVVIDPISAYLGDIDSHRNTDVRAVLAPLSDLARDLELAVVAVTHLNKSIAAAGSAIHRTMGSVAFTAAARAVWTVSRDRHDPDRRLLAPAKNNLGVDNTSLAYRLHCLPGQTTPCIAFEETPVAMTADDVLAAPREEAAPRESASPAAAFLTAALRSGARPMRELVEEAAQHGLTPDMLRTGRERLGIKPRLTGRQWWWSLPTPAA